MRGHTFNPSSDFIVAVVAIAAGMANYTPILTPDGALMADDGRRTRFFMVVLIMHRLEFASP